MFSQYIILQMLQSICYKCWFSLSLIHNSINVKYIIKRLVTMEQTCLTFLEWGDAGFFKMWRLLVCSKVVSISPHFVLCTDLRKKLWLLLKCFLKVLTNNNLIPLLLISYHMRHKSDDNPLHVQILHQNTLPQSKWDFHLCSYCANGEMPVIINKFPNSCHAFISLPHGWMN